MISFSELDTILRANSEMLKGVTYRTSKFCKALRSYVILSPREEVQETRNSPVDSETDKKSEISSKEEILQVQNVSNSANENTNETNDSTETSIRSKGNVKEAETVQDENLENVEPEEKKSSRGPVNMTLAEQISKRINEEMRVIVDRTEKNLRLK